jgi:isopenicillin N synthase-like dioxygenase
MNTFFQLNHSEKEHTLSLLHYSPLDHFIENGEVVVAGEHSDYGTITLLFQDQVGGLQVRDLQGK